MTPAEKENKIIWMRLLKTMQSHHEQLMDRLDQQEKLLRQEAWLGQRLANRSNRNAVEAKGLGNLMCRFRGFG